MGVLLFTGSTCGNGDPGAAFKTLGPATAGSSPFPYTVTLSAGLTSNSYSAQAEDASLDSFGVCVPFTVMSAAPPIPEYLYGLPLLAILMLIGYGLVRRRIRNTD